MEADLRAEQAIAVRRVQYGYIVYQIVASALGAFAISEFLKHFVQIDWHGLLATQAAVWNVFVVPVQTTVFSWMEKISGETFEPFWRDYLTVGAVVLLSFARATLAYDMSSTGNQILRWGELALDLVQHLFLWPIAFVRSFLGVFERDPENAPYIVMLTLLPFVYIGVMLAINAMIR
jgi:hypothetical protein